MRELHPLYADAGYSTRASSSTPSVEDPVTECREATNNIPRAQCSASHSSVSRMIEEISSDRGSSLYFDAVTTAEAASRAQETPIDTCQEVFGTGSAIWEPGEAGDSSGREVAGGHGNPQNVLESQQLGPSWEEDWLELDERHGRRIEEFEAMYTASSEVFHQWLGTLGQEDVADLV